MGKISPARPSAKASRTMIRSIAIDNFRGFRNLSLDGFRRLNIIVGDNSSGKTAILEAMFLASGASPQVVAKLRAWRGFNPELTGEPLEIIDAFWRDLFFDYSYSKSAHVNLGGTNGDSREMLIQATSNHRSHQEVISLTAPDKETSRTYRPLRFGWRGAHDKDFHWEEPEITGRELTVNVRETNISSYFISSAHPVAPKFLASLLSNLRQNGKEGPFIAAMIREFPFISDITPEITAGTSMLYAKLKNKQKRQPLNLVSVGVYKVANILLHMMQAKKGFVCIDEIENGVYYSRLPSLWKAVDSLSSQHSSQVFATTHSLECLQAAAKTLSPNDLSLTQVFREGGYSRALITSGENAIAAIKGGLEVRS